MLTQIFSSCRLQTTSKEVHDLLVTIKIALENKLSYRGYVCSNAVTLPYHYPLAFLSPSHACKFFGTIFGKGSVFRLYLRIADTSIIKRKPELITPHVIDLSWPTAS